MISAGEFRNGVTFEQDGQVLQVVEFQHVKPGKGAAFVRTKTKNVITGSVVETSYNPTAKFPQAFIERKDVTYSYEDGDLYHFMDNETYDDIPVNAADVPDNFKFCKENELCKLLSYKGKVFSVEIPNFIELEVTQTGPHPHRYPHRRVYGARLIPLTPNRAAGNRLPGFLKLRFFHFKEGIRMELNKKAAYLQGLVDGLGIDDTTKEGKIIKAMSALLGEMAEVIESVDEDLSRAYDQINDLSDELEDLEADLYEEEDEDGESEDAEDEDTDGDDDAKDDDIASEPFYEVACPNCGETVYVSEDDLDAGEANCAHCGVTFEVALEGDGEEDAEDGPVQYEVTCPELQVLSVEEGYLWKGTAKRMPRMAPCSTK